MSEQMASDIVRDAGTNHVALRSAVVIGLSSNEKISHGRVPANTEVILQWGRSYHFVIGMRAR